MGSLKILDTTLRDGSYSIDFSFTTTDVFNICESLENAGFEYIEIGHGVGIGAATKGYQSAIHTDFEYLEVAKKAVKKAKIGMFSIAGVSEFSDIKALAENGLDFIRIGAEVAEIDSMEPYIKTAKLANMEVSANLMKSYTHKPADFAQEITKLCDFGADMAYLVDSAGGMFPDDIRNYYEAVRAKTDLPLGFHGHNNLGLAIANTLEAVKCGYEYIDTSLQGLGRSSGNASTEIMIAILDKLKIASNIDLFKVIDSGQRYIHALAENKINELDLIAGYADFHSSYMNIIQNISAKYSVDPRKLIIEMTKIDKVSVDKNKAEQVASKMDKFEISAPRFAARKYRGGEQK